MLDATTNTPVTLPQQAAATAYDRCQVSCGSRPAWCAVVTHIHAERRAHASLHRFGFEAYLPLVDVRWADRTWHSRPLFPRYCFVRLDLTKPWSPVIAAPGVFQLVSFDGRPATCSDTAVEAVRSAVDGFEAFSASSSRWQPGQPCSLAAGPLAGLPAVVTDVSQETATIALMMLGHLRTITVPLSALTHRPD